MTTRSRTLKSGSALLEFDPELEALGIGIAPGLTGDDRSERERAEIDAGQYRRGAPVADSPMVSPGLVEEAVERAVGRRRVRPALGMPSAGRISDEVIDGLLAGASTEEEIAGPGGLLAELTKRLVERAMEVELTDHVGYEPLDAEDVDHRARPVRVETPRDRDGSFQPKIVKKRQRRFVGFDEKILALYSRGLDARHRGAPGRDLRREGRARPDQPRDKQRGVRDILIACVDGLTGFPEAIEAIFPKTTVQSASSM